MNQHAMRMGVVAFVLLTCALATNVLVLQPPNRNLASATPSERLREMQASHVSNIVVPAPAVSSVPAREPGKDSQSAELTRAIQRELAAKSYETGGVDGVASRMTRAAILAYQSDHQLPLTGEPQPELLQHIVLGEAGPQAGVPSAAAPEMSADAKALLIEVAAALTDAGYPVAPRDGTASLELSKAIRAFEVAQHMKPTGRVSAEVLVRLDAQKTKHTQQ